MLALARVWSPASPGASRNRGGSAEGEIWSSEYWANKGGVKLNLWRKRVGAPKPGEKPLPVLFLVHGSSNSTRSSYDLSVPGKGEYSLMNVMARYGFDVWTMDHDGYGHSGTLRQQLRHRQRRRGPEGRDSGGGEGDRPAEDAFLRHLVGRASAPAPIAQAQPERVDRLMLSAFTYKGSGAAGDRAAAARASTSCAPTRGASATPR